MRVVKAALIATSAAAATLIVAGGFQVWLTGVMLDRELDARIDRTVGGTYAEVRDVNLLPAFVLTLVVFVGVLFWRVRRRG